ncbi:hypothetical protein GQF01_23865 [Paenibacillus sp. 5J-6]|uniref:Uncharacterized protein n=1 Tax=Paenibacillus silvestris TaxID=2606219 RepID=A0A6L8V6C5_9BACL|nr:hypothetical protein [Paenibacillus silvestris]
MCNSGFPFTAGSQFFIRQKHINKDTNRCFSCIMVS